MRKLVIAALLFTACAGLVLCERSAMQAAASPDAPIASPQLALMVEAHRQCQQGLTIACLAQMELAAGIGQ